MAQLNELGETMTPEAYRELVEALSGCRTAAHCAPLLAQLESALSAEPEMLSKKEILSLMQDTVRLWGELSRIEILDRAEGIIRRLIELDPRDAHSRVLMSEFYFYDRDEPEQALELAQEALSEAESSGSFFNLAAGNLARIAAKLNKFQILTFAMTKVLEHTSRPDCVDTKIESDFIARLPEGAISDQLIASYLEKVHPRKS